MLFICFLSVVIHGDCLNSSKSVVSEPTEASPIATTEPVSCLDGFYYVANSMCQLCCDCWQQFSEAQSLALGTVEVLAHAIGPFVSVAMVVTTILFDRKL